MKAKIKGKRWLLTIVSMALIVLVGSTVFTGSYFTDPEGSVDNTLCISTGSTTGWLTGWCYRVKITIDHNDFDEDATHFPVLVHLSSACGKGGAYDLTPVFDELGANSKRIAVTEDDGETQLYVEIEKWDETAEEAWLWVSRSGWTISSTVDTDIYLYYCNTQPENTSYVGDSGSRTEVWDSNFQGVWHLSETSGGGSSSIEFVNETDGYGSGSATTIAASAASHTAGNLLAVIVANSGMTAERTVSSISDTAGNTYTFITSASLGSAVDYMRVEIWYAKNISGNANNVVTATFSGSAQYREISVLQYSGVDTTDPYDVSNTGTGDSTSQTTAASTTTFADEVIVAGYYDYDSGTYTAGTNFTLRYDGTYLGTEDRIVSSTGSYGSAMTYSTSTDYAAVHATFKAASIQDTIKDSTANANHGTDYGSPTLGADGWVDGCVDFAGTASYIDCGTSQFGLNDSSNATFEVWCRKVSTTWHLFLYGRGANHQPASMRQAGDKFRFNLTQTDGNTQFDSPTVSIPANYYIAWAIHLGGSSDYELFQDGSFWFDGTTGYTGGLEAPAGSAYPWQIGCIYDWGTHEYDSKIDEVRISDSARSAAWIKATYETCQDDMLDFGNIEDEEVEAGWLTGWCYRVKITIDHNDFDENVTHFPVLVHLSDACGIGNAYDLTPVFDEVGANSKRIAVTEDDGTTQLYVEIEKWDETAEEAWLWVSKSGWTISSTVDTDIYLYFCNSQPDNTTYVGDSGSRTEVWNNNFKGVWHLSETGGGGGIAVDAVSTGDDTSCPSLTISHTTSGSDRLMIVGVSMNPDNNETVDNVTYNNVALTLIGTDQEADDARVELWYLVAPDTGTHNVVITFSTTLLQGAAAGAITFTGVNQTNPLGTPTFAAGETTGPAEVDVSSATGELVVDTVATEEVGVTADGSQDVQWDIEPSTQYSGGSTKAGAATVTMSWDLDTETEWAIGAVPIKPAPSVKDSTANANHGTDSGSPTFGATGEIDGSIDFDGDDDYVDAGSDSSLDNLAAITASCWAKIDGWGEGGLGRIFDKDYKIWILWDGDTDLESIIDYTTTNAGTEIDVAGIVADGYLHHLVLTWDSAGDDTIRMYVDGIEASYETQTAGVGTPLDDSAESLYIGNRADTTRTFDGIIDEMRISDTARSTAWVKASYENERDDLLTFGSIEGEEEEADWLSGWCKRVKITIDHNDFDEDATHFPVLIHLSDACGIGNAHDLTPVFDEVGGNSKKIAVTEDDGTTQLYVEIEKWDETAEEAWLWVSKSGWTISSSTDTDIYLYYCSTQPDNTTYVGDSGSRTEVWDSNFKGVWHLKEANTRLVMVTSDGTYDNGYDSDKKTFFESLGYTVSVIAAGAAQGTYDSAASSNDIMFITDTAGSSPGTKARGLDIGIVSEEISTWRDLMYGSNTGTMSSSGTQFNITDNSHYITSPFDIGNLTVYSSSTMSDYWSATLPAGAQVLAKPPSSPTSYAIIAFEQGAELFGSNTAANRRVFVSTGSSNYNYWNADLKTLLGRTLKWGAKGEIHYDSTSNANNGIGSGNIPATGNISNGQDFDGDDDYVDCGTDSSLDLGTGDFSISAWVKSSYTGSELQVITSNHLESPWTGWMLTIESGGLYLFYTIENPNPTQVYSTSTVDTDWHHITGVRDSTDHKIYVDGAWEATTSGTVRNVTNSENTYIAYEDDPSQWDQFKGILDEIRISDTARNTAWIEASYETQIDDMLTFGSIESEEEEAGWLTGWCYRVKITIDHNDFDEDTTHFPVLIHLSDACGIGNAYDLTPVFDEVGANSKKIAVTEDDGETQLYVEIEKWDETAEEAWLWVSKSGWTISSAVDTDIYLYFCNSQPDNDTYVGDSGSRTEVWDSNFKGVWHLSETGGGGGIAVDAVSSNTGTGDNITVSHTTSGTNRLMLVGISSEVDGATITSVKYNNVDLELVGGVDEWYGVWIYKLVAPDTGTHELVVTLSSAPYSGSVVGVTTFTGVDQSIPLGTFASNSGTSGILATVDVSSAAGELVFDTVSTDEAVTVGSGQTQRWNDAIAGWTGAGSTEPGAASVTMSWDLGASGYWSIGAVPIKPAPSVKDSTSNANHGIDSGSPTFGATGEIDGSIDFDGNGDYVDVPDDNSLDVTNVTLSAWVKSDTTGRYIIAKDPPDTEILRPNAAGDEENIFQSYPITGKPHWQMVDEEVADDLTTYLRDDEDWHRDLYNLPDHSEGSGTINYIKVYARCQASTTVDMTSLKLAIKTGGTPHESSEITLTTDWVDYSNQWDINPTTEAAWTWDDIDALQIGLVLRRCNTSWDFSYCTQVYVEVDYTPAGAKSDVPYALSTVGGGQFMFVSSNTTYSANSTTDINDSQWHHLTGTYDGETIRLYVDSALEDTNTDPSGNLPTNDGNVRIGADYQTTPANFFDGIIDEMRASDTARSGAWVKASYESERDDLLTFGNIESEEEEAGWLSGWCKRVKITIDSDDFDEDATHFPVLIHLSDACGIGNAHDLTPVFDEVGGNSKRIAVTEDDGETQLYVEIEKWDETAEEAWLWVSRSGWTISSTSDTDIYLYYCNSQPDNTTYVGDSGSRTEVWDSNFKGVWHLGETSNEITVDAVSSNTGTGDNITVSHTTGSGLNRLMLVGISTFSGDTNTISSVKYNNVDLTLVGTEENYVSDSLQIWIYKLVAPDVGTHDLVVDFAAAPGFGGVVGVSTFTGVDQNNPLGSFVSDTGTASPATVDASSAEGELVFDTLATWASDASVGPGQTQRWNQLSSYIYGAGSTEPGAATVTMSWNLTSPDYWTIGAVPIKPASTSEPGIEVDDVSSGTGDSSITIEHTTSGENRLMLVGIYADVGDPFSITSITYNSDNLTLVGFSQLNWLKVWIYKLVAPDTGTHNMVVNFSTTTSNRAAAGVMTFTGVDQTTPLGTFAGATGSASPATVNVASASGELVFDTVGDRDYQATVGAGQTERWNIEATQRFCASSTEPGAASVDMTWTFTDTYWAIGAVPIKPAPPDTVKDSTANANHGNDNGSPTFEATGQINGAIGFDGDDDYLDVSSMNPQSYDDFTVSAWYKASHSAVVDDEFIFSHLIDYADGPGIVLSITDDSSYADYLRVSIYDNSTNFTPYYGTSDVVDQQCHYVVGTRGGGRIKIYVDGANETDAADVDTGETINVDAPSGPHIGDLPGDTEQLYGILDEVRISDTARNAAWIDASYESERDDLLDFGSEEIGESGGLSYYETVAALSPDYWWKLDGDETDSADDAGSDGGTPPSWVSSIIPSISGTNQCGDYNGSSSETLIPNKNNINIDDTYKKSISVWIEADTIDTSGNGRAIWEEGGGSNGLVLYVYNDSGTPRLYFIVYEGSNRDYISYPISTGTVYHVGATLDCNAGEMRLYLDGAEVANKTSGLNIGSELDSHQGGAAIGGIDTNVLNHTGATLSGLFDGRIADVVYWAEQNVLSESDFDSIYDAGQ